MAYYDVALSESIDFAPKSLVEEVLQNVRTILKTNIKTVPYDRELGINPRYIDDPFEISKLRFQADIIEAIHKNEPRCRVDSISYEDNELDGFTMPKIRIFINE